MRDKPGEYWRTSVLPGGLYDVSKVSGIDVRLERNPRADVTAPEPPDEHTLARRVAIDQHVASLMDYRRRGFNTLHGDHERCTGAMSVMAEIADAVLYGHTDVASIVARADAYLRLWLEAEAREVAR